MALNAKTSIWEYRPPMPVVEFKAQYASELHSSEDSDNVNEEGRENNFEVWLEHKEHNTNNFKD